jgi:hypothetical protein
MAMHCIRTLICVVSLGCCVAYAADEASLKKVLKEGAEEVNNALVKGDFETIVDYTHPELVKHLGGREKAITAMGAAMKDLMANGISLTSFTVGEPSDTVAGDSQLFAVVPFELRLKSPDGRILLKGYLIGISSDQGRSWKYLDGRGDTKLIKKCLPNLPEKLKLPEKQAPVVEKGE